MKNFYELIKRFFTYSACLGCGNKHSNELLYHVCPVCSNTFLSIERYSEEWGESQNDTHTWESLEVFFPYKNNISQNLVYLYKFKDSILAERDLSILLQKKLEAFHEEILIPLPCSKETYTRLGFHPVIRILDNLGIGYYNVLAKSKANHSQKKLSGKERRNQANFIKLTDSIPKEWGNKKIFLIDDIVTTGVTMMHATNILKEQGFENIHALCFFHD